MTEAKSEETKATGLSLKEAAEMLGMDEARVKILGGQGRLIEGGTHDELRYDLASVL